MSTADEIARHMFWPSTTFHLRDALPYFGPRFLTPWLECRRSPEPMPVHQEDERFDDVLWLICAAMNWGWQNFPKQEIPQPRTSGWWGNRSGGGTSNPSAAVPAQNDGELP